MSSSPTVFFTSLMGKSTSTMFKYQANVRSVLNPDKPSATANPTASTQEAAFSGASSVSDIPFTSGIPAGTEAGATGLSPETSTEGAAQATAAIALGALFGGAALVMNV